MPARAPTSSCSSTSPRRPRAAATLLDIVERTARRAFIPLTVGGGVRSVDEMRDVLRAGADKVSLNTRAVADPALVTACAARFGSQAVVVAIDAASVAATPTFPSGFEVVVKGGRESAGLDAVAWAVAGRRARGRRAARDLDRPRRDEVRLRHCRSCARSPIGSEVPVIASGGAAGAADCVAAVRDGGADAVLAAGIFHRREVSIAEVKAAMAAAGLPVRAIRRPEPPHDRRTPGPVDLDARPRSRHASPGAPTAWSRASSRTSRTGAC